MQIGVRSASYIFWEGVRALIAEAGKRFPSQLSAAAIAARGNQARTVCLVASEALLIPKTKIDPVSS